MQLIRLISACVRSTSAIATFPWRSRLLSICCVFFLVGWLPTLHLLHADFQDTFESSEVAWQLRHSDCQAKITIQERQFRNAHSGAGCEFVQIEMSRGTYAHLTYSIPPVRVIDELQPGLWIKSNRMSLQIMARVILPRTIDPKSGKPLKFLIHGSQYELAGQWQRLSIKRCREAMMRQIPSLRSQFGSTVNPKQAFIDMIVLNTYGGIGSTSIWTDDLRIATPITGYVSPNQNQPAAELSTGSPVASAAYIKNGSTTENSVQVKGNLLLVDKRPFFARIIEYNGEPFQWLQKLGFNTIALKDQPTAHQIKEATRLGMWLTIPPANRSAGQPVRTTADRCLAFDLGDHLTHRHLAASRQMISSIHDLELRGMPLITAAPSGELNSYSRQCDVLRLPWNPIYQSVNLNSATRSLRERASRLQHGTSYWTTISTQPPTTLIGQWTAFGTQHLFPRNIEPEQIRFLVFSAIASGTRGLYFRSWSRLDAPDTSTEIRSNTLELINREIQLIQPWLAGGVYLGDLDTNTTDVRTSMWQTDRAKLLILLRSSARQQFVTSPTKSKSFSFDVPGTPVTYRPYYLHRDGPKTLQSARGNQIHLSMQKDERISLVVLTADQLVRDYLYEQTSLERRREAHLRLKVVIDRHSQFKQISASVPPASQPEQAKQTLRIAEQHLSQAQALLNSGDRTGANQFTEKADQSLRQLRWDLWNQAVRFFPTPVSSPYCIGFQTLPNHWELVEQMKTRRWGPNILNGSDFEDLQLLKQAGWLHHQEAATGHLAVVELSAKQPHEGNYCLHLSTQDQPSTKPSESSQRPRVRIISGSVDIKAGSRLRIHGWAKVSPRSQNHSDGLLIYDSLGGPTLGDRIRPTLGWQEFILYRAAPRSGSFHLTCELQGPGEAWLDSVSVQLQETVPANPPLPVPSQN
jgi:hypothetical protein